MKTRPSPADIIVTKKTKLFLPFIVVVGGGWLTQLVCRPSLSFVSLRWRILSLPGDRERQEVFALSWLPRHGPRPHIDDTDTFEKYF